MKFFPAEWMMVGVLLLELALPPLRADPVPVNFTGHYEQDDNKSGQSFSLDITQTRNQVVISFSAAMVDGSGAAPDGDGKGTMDKWGRSFKFTFKDSFGNEGTGSLVAGKANYQLRLNPTKVVDPRAVRFYGYIILGKTSNKVQTDGA